MARLRSPSNCFYRNLWTQSSITTGGQLKWSPFFRNLLLWLS